MKITKSELREIIREEIQALKESKSFGRIGNDYIKFLAVAKHVKELEDEQRKMLQMWKSEKDEKRKNQIHQKMRDGTKRLENKRVNLSSLERDFVLNLDNYTPAPLDY
jgi:hypothetical protein